MKKQFLLECEDSISEKDLSIRETLIKEFLKFPIEFLSKMRHFQPQIGCPNKCGFCSQFSSCYVESFNNDGLKNIIAAIKYTAMNYVKSKPYLAWERTEHRIGVIFPYLDNDIGNYRLLDEFIKLCYNELGVTVRISTVSFSRHNEDLQKMHFNIVNTDIINGLAGVRISVAPFGLAWESKTNKYSIEEYKHDIANFLRIYKKYYDFVGAGSRKFCIELRYKPLIHLENINVFNFNGYYAIKTQNDLYISCEKLSELELSYINDAIDHNLSFSNSGYKFKHYNNIYSLKTENILKRKYEIVNIYEFSNIDGIYYCVNPQMSEDGNKGIIIYPKTQTRKKSGIMIIERYLLNAMSKVKEKYGHKLSDKLENATYDDVENIFKLLNDISDYYKENNKKYISEYITNEIITVFKIVIDSLKQANYPASCVFDKDFLIDTGTICNLGRGIKYFKGLVTKINEPLTPIHERNYGKKCSTMVKEGIAWRLSCYRDNSIIIQKLNLADTSDVSGQVKLSKTLKIHNHFNDHIDCYKNTYYLIPGEKK